MNFTFIAYSKLGGISSSKFLLKCFNFPTLTNEVSKDDSLHRLFVNVVRSIFALSKVLTLKNAPFLRNLESAIKIVYPV